jgi:hypothetical protein
MIVEEIPADAPAKESDVEKLQAALKKQASPIELAKMFI